MRTIEELALIGNKAVKKCLRSFKYRRAWLHVVVFPEDITGGKCSSFDSWFRRAITISYKHPHYPREYLRLRAKTMPQGCNNRSGYFSAGYCAHKFVCVAHWSGTNPPCCFKRWGVEYQRKGLDGSTVALGSIDLGVDNVLTEMAPGDISIEFPRFPDPVHNRDADILTGSPQTKYLEEQEYVWRAFLDDSETVKMPGDPEKQGWL